MDGGAWWAAVHGVAEGRTRLSDFTFTFHFHALEKEMATHSRVFAWRILGMGEPGGLPSMGSHRVGHDWSDLAAAAYSLLSQGESCMRSWSARPCGPRGLCEGMSKPPHISGQRGHCICKATQRGCGLSLAVCQPCKSLAVRRGSCRKFPEIGHMLPASGSFCVTGVTGLDPPKCLWKMFRIPVRNHQLC